MNEEIKDVFCGKCGQKTVDFHIEVVEPEAEGQEVYQREVCNERCAEAVEE